MILRIKNIYLERDRDINGKILGKKHNKELSLNVGIMISLDCICFLHFLTHPEFSTVSDTLIISKYKQKKPRLFYNFILFYNIMSKRTVLCKPTYTFYFDPKNPQKTKNLGIALKDVGKAFIAPDDVVCFGPPL